MKHWKIVRANLVVICLLATLLCAATAAAGNSYYVSQSTGNDANPGTQSEPFQYHPWMGEFSGSALLQAGDTVYMKCGDVWSAANPLNINGFIDVSAGGTEGNLITTTQYGSCTASNKPLIEITDANTNKSIIYGDNSSYLKFDGLHLQHSVTFGTGHFIRSGIFLYGIAVHHIYIENMEINNVFNGIKCDYNCWDFYVGDMNATQTATAANHSNYIHDYTYQGVSLNGTDPGGNSNNNVYYNYITDSFTSTSNGSSCGTNSYGIAFGTHALSDYDPNYIYARYNRVENNDTWVCIDAHNETNAYAEYNYVYNCPLSITVANYVRHNTIVNPGDQACINQSASGMIYSSGDGIEITDNTIYFESRPSTALSHGMIRDPGDALIARNHIYDGPTSGFYAAIEIQPGESPAIQYNIIHDVKWGIHFMDPLSGLTTNIYNNIFETEGVPLYFGSNNIAGTLNIKNNIFMFSGPTNIQYIDVTGANTGTLNIDNNLYYNSIHSTPWRLPGTGAQDWSGWQGLGYDINGINGQNPQFISSNDFHLQSGSPVINAGANVGLTTDFDGNSIAGLPEIGAYEFTEAPVYACSDALDNDGDSLTDYPADPGCSSDLDDDEYNDPPPADIAHWTFDEGTGTTAWDETGNGNEGSLINNPTWIDGAFDGGLSLDGINDYILVGDSSDWDFGGKEITIAFWFKAGVQGRLNFFFEHFAGGSISKGWYMGLDGNFTFRYVGANEIYLQSTGMLDDDNWHHVVITMDGSTASLYIDGALDSTDSYSYLRDLNQTLYIGSNGASRFINGVIDEIRIYGRALELSEALQLYYYQGAPIYQCSDGLDNDTDGLTDFPADPGCTSATDDDEYNAPVYQCSDSLDNDTDGLTDFPADPGCTSATDDDEYNAPVYQCSDSLDNDTDGLTDFPADPGCTSATDDDEYNAPVYQCSDSLDNDTDGLTDFPADPGCTSATDDDEYNAPVYQCSDSLDNDTDGLTDYPADPGCTSATDDDEYNAPVYQCSDGLDNDTDGLTDFPADPGCTSATDDDEYNAPVYQCSDSLDNDTDGLTDFPADPGCTSATDDDEYNAPVYQCSDSLDNDTDGLTDYPADPGCTSATDDDEYNAPVYQCSDSLDNDTDGLTDYPADPGCTSATDNDEYNAPVSGTVKIMPLGDSITYGFNGGTGIGGYRDDLYFSLINANFDFDFVGSLTAGTGSGWDMDNEGHGGWMAHEIKVNIYNWLVLNPADMILLHIGTNDINEGETAAEVLADIVGILNEIDRFNPQITIFLGQIINRQDVGQPKYIETSNLNALIGQINRPNVVIVNMEAELTPSDLVDIVHPDDGGYLKMADKWLSILYCNLSGAGIQSSCPQCFDGVDNDGDTFKDMTDSGCSSVSDNDEYSPQLAVDPIAHWTFDEVSGTTAEDATGRGNMGTLANGPVWTTGKINGALGFDGGDDHVAVSNSMTPAQFTLAAWVKSSGSGNYKGIITSMNISRGVGNRYHGYMLGIAQYASKRKYTLMIGAGGDNAQNAYSDNYYPSSDTGWHHIVGTYDGTTGKLYIDGVKQADEASIVIAYSGDNVDIGRYYTDLDANNWNGTIDEVRIYERVLSASEVLDLFNDTGVPPVYQCSDGLDNDTDGLTDYPADPGCTSATDDDEYNAPVYQCSDGLDNDTDGLTDYPADPGCASATDDDEYNAPVYQCSDGLDNDTDGLTDFPADPGCTSATDDDEYNAPVYQCSDGLDNDTDGLTDYPADPGCTSATDDDEYNAPVYQCSDGLDNDTDGLTDFPADPGCTSATDDDEYNAPVYQCSDGLDNDTDGLTDYPADPGCSSATDDDEYNAPQCSDGVDNDTDGLTDYPADPGCTSATDDDEYNAPVYQCSDGLDNDTDGLTDFPADPGCASIADNDENDPPSSHFQPFGVVTVSPAFTIAGAGLNIDSLAFWETSNPDDTLLFVTAKDNNLIEVWKYPFINNEQTSLTYSFSPNGVHVDQDREWLLVGDASNGNLKVYSLPDYSLLRTIGDGIIGVGETNLDVLDNSNGEKWVYVSDDHSLHYFNLDSGAYINSFSPNVESIEELLADNLYQSIYVPDEQGRVSTVNPGGGISAHNPDGSAYLQNGTNFFGDQNHYDADEEGIILYTCPSDGSSDDGRGFIVSTDQSLTDNGYEFYNRQTWEHLGTLKLSGIINTDGITSTQRALTGYPSGIFAAVNNDTSVAIVGWDTILQATGLSCDGLTMESGLVARWTFDEGTGTTAGDASGNGHTATLVNGPIWTGGTMNGGLSFDGINDYLNIGYSSDWNFANKDITIAIWYKAGVQGKLNYLLEHFTGGSRSKGWYLALNKNIIFRHGGANDIILQSTNILDDNEWHHIVITMSTTTAHLYIDGLLDATDYYISLTDWNQVLYAGSTGGSKFLNGIIDELRIYGRTLDAGEVLELYNYSSP